MNEKIQQAVEFYRNGDKQSAFIIFRQVITETPNDPYAWYELALCVESKEQKVDCLKRVLAINPGHEKAQKLLDSLTNPKLVSQEPISKPVSHVTQPQQVYTPIAPSAFVTNEFSLNPPRGIFRKSIMFIIPFLFLINLVYSLVFQSGGIDQNSTWYPYINILVKAPFFLLAFSILDLNLTQSAFIALLASLSRCIKVLTTFDMTGKDASVEFLIRFKQEWGYIPLKVTGFDGRAFEFSLPTSQIGLFD